jgi:hypothetical protein
MQVWVTHRPAYSLDLFCFCPFSQVQGNAGQVGYIPALDPQWRCCPHCDGVVAVFKLASLPCFSLQKAAQVRLDNLGLVKNHSCFVNNLKRIKILEQRLELQHSIGRLEEIQKSSALEKELAEMDKLSPLLSEAIVMYKANETSKRGFTKDCIKSILLTVCGIPPPNSRPPSSKSEWLKLLQQQDKDNPGKIDTLIPANTTADLATPATQSNTNTHWLYQQCQQAKVNMMTDVSPFEMSLVVLQALRYGARMGGSKTNAVNLFLRLFLYHILHTMSL